LLKKTVHYNVPTEQDNTLANSVLPHPGGPANKMPGGVVKPNASNSSGFCTGA